MPADAARTTRIAILSSATGGGGGIAATRMAEALNRQPGIEAEFLSSEELGGLLPGAVAPGISLSNRKLSDTHFTLEYPGYVRTWLVDFLSAYDVVNVQWASYLIGLAELDALARRGVRMLFMLHDFYYITGGCHYPSTCRGMARGCLDCEQFDATRGDINFVPVNLRAKKSIFSHSNVHLVAPSHWLCNQALATGIVPEERAHVLRNPYVPALPYRPRSSDGVRRVLVIADSLSERRKGMPMAVAALDLLAAHITESMLEQPVEAHVVGAADDVLKAMLDGCRLPCRLHGRITEHQRLVDIFAASDLVLTCSTEDNWPNILVESGAYGCIPVVGPGHGCEEFVRLYGQGRVARGYTAEAFADALAAALGEIPDDASSFATAVRDDHAPAHIAAEFLRIAASVDRPPQ